MTGRAWWVAPVVAAAVGGGAFAAVALPGLAGGVSVPDRLVVPRSAPTSMTPTTATTRPSSAASPTTQVVVPNRPVVRESADRNDTAGETSSDRKYRDSGARGG